MGSPKRKAQTVFFNQPSDVQTTATTILTIDQGHNEVRRRPGQEASLCALMFEPEVFRK